MVDKSPSNFKEVSFEDSDEGFQPWLARTLNMEREALQELHQVQSAMVERHLQLLAELQAKLCHGAGVACIHAEHSKNIETQTSGPDGDWTSWPRAESASIALTSTEQKQMDSRRSSGYKNKTLKLLAGQRSFGSDKHSLRRIVKSPTFESVSGMAIVMNTLVLAAEVEYYGFDSGHDIGYKNYMSSSETWPGAESLFDTLDKMFVIFFVLELLMRIGAAGLKSLRSGWIWFDFVIVSASVVSWFQTSDGPERPGVPAMIRITRLARMMRVFKVIRVVRAFDSLFLLIRSIQASVGALFWSFVLLIGVVTAVGMCLSQILRSYIQDDSHDLQKREQVFLLYGTFTRSMVTMFEITLGNWVPSCRTLMDNVSEWFGLFYVLYCCCFIFAMIRVIQAVFIAETNRVVAADDQIALVRKQRDKEVYLKKLHKMFEELDVSGDKQLSREEVHQISEDKLLKTMLSTLDINVHDLETLFDLLDEGNGQIDIDKFVTGLSRVKGAAQSIDLVSVLLLAQKLDSKVDRILDISTCSTLVSPVKAPSTLVSPVKAPRAGKKVPLLVSPLSKASEDLSCGSIDVTLQEDEREFTASI